ncbi:hypothetical protein Ddye_010723 [Dipteronia dyeriana]|uniref:Uncharacterized protein n=1 Tax=Dipteronia dyeriana TaxID=168575 RepID=A0AAE0CNJ4_9ROSI|nr:hypothetical protein Ddye_010723 [Dipteronia dyeriana]
MDSLLWIAPHTRVVSIDFHQHRHWYLTSFEFSYKKPVSCCKFRPSCWQHCIDEVQIEIFIIDSIDNEDVMERYSLEGAEFLEKIDGLLGLDKSRHCIEEAQIEISDEEGNVMKRFSLAGAEFLEKIKVMQKLILVSFNSFQGVLDWKGKTN